MTVTSFTPELHELAKEKALKLPEQNQIRLCGGEFDHSHWLINMGGMIYIGYLLSEPCENFFKNKKVYTFGGPNGKVDGYFQRLF